jgi:threonine/homoserine/homoserine lactone efflux protein
LLLANIQLILAGVLIGVLTAAPVGPVNVMCIQRTLERGFFAGFAAGLGAVIGDGLIALAGAFGINAISDLMERNDHLLRLVGSGVLIVFGLKLWTTEPIIDAEGRPIRESHSEGLLDYVWSIPQTFFLTITNPGAVLAMFLMVGGAGSAIGGLNSTAEALTLVTAIVGGGVLWWFFLAGLISRIRHKLTQRSLKIINQMAGATLIVFGAAVLAHLAAKTVGLL